MNNKLNEIKIQEQFQIFLQHLNRFKDSNLWFWSSTRHQRKITSLLNVQELYQSVKSFPKSSKVNHNLQISVNNLRIYLDRLIWSIQEMITKGVLRPHQLQGISYQQFEKNKKQFKQLDQQKLQYAIKPVVQPPFKFVPDKYFQRHGVILPQNQNAILKDAIQIAKKVLQPKKQITQVQQILNTIEQIRNAIMQIFPAYIGLPQWQPVLLILEQKLELQVLVSEKYQLFDMKATVWWAGKQLDKKKTLLQYAGKNQKTRIIIKVQRFGGQLPARQPPIDAETYSKMVKFYYKKVEENKQFQQKSVQNHYQKIETENMKEKLYLQDSLRFKPF